MYELVVLALLMWGPTHGFAIEKVMNELYGPFARASNGTLRPLLKRLEDRGLIVGSLTEGDHLLVIRVYEITESGKSRFRALMMDTRRGPRRHRELFVFKAAFFPLIEPEERVRLVQHYVAFCRAHLAHLAAIQREGRKSEAYRFARAPVPVFDHALRHGMERWRLEITWAMALVEDLPGVPLLRVAGR